MTFEKRTADIIRTTADTATDRELKASINLIGRIPLFSLTQQAGTGASHADVTDAHDVVFNTAVQTATIDASEIDNRYNILYDRDKTDRFTAIAVCSTAIGGRDGMLYYDKEYGDLLLIADLTSIGLNDLTHRGFNVDAYVVGGNCGMDEFDSAYVSIDNYSRMRTEIATPTKLKTKMHLLTITIGGKTQGNSIGVMLGTTYYTESKYINLTSVMGIGSTATVFGGPTKVYKAVRTGGTTYRFIDMGIKDVDQLTFQMPWE